MAFVTRNAPRPVTGREVVDRWMESAFGSPWSSLWNQAGGTASSVHRFPVDIYESPESYVVLAAIPGVNPDEVQITALDGTLSIGVDVKPTIDEGFAALYREMSFGQYRRDVRLPGDFSFDQAEATYESGLLKLVLPKAEHVKPKSLHIKSTHSG